MIYPLTIILDRYNGTYSSGKYIAWNLEPNEIPKESQGSDTTSAFFWKYNKIPCGKGNTPEEAIKNLKGEISKTETVYIVMALGDDIYIEGAYIDKEQAAICKEELEKFYKENNATIEVFIEETNLENKCWRN